MELPQALTGAVIHELVDSVDTEHLSRSDHSLIFSSDGLQMYYYYKFSSKTVLEFNHGLIATRQTMLAGGKGLV